MAPRKKKAEIVEMTDVIKEQQTLPKEQPQVNNVEITNTVPVKKPYVRPLRRL